MDLADIGWGIAREVEPREVEPGDLSVRVVLAALDEKHEGAGVFDFGGSVALEAFVGLVEEILVGDLDGGDGTVAVLDPDLVTRLEVFVVGVEDDGETEDEAVREGNITTDL